MTVTRHNPPGVFPPYANYAHAVEVPAGARTLYVSGLNGFEEDGSTMPADFEGQVRLIWRHLGVVLESAGMSIADLVSLRFYLAETAHDPANVAILRENLVDHLTARTVVCQQLLEPDWLVELEAVAAKVD